jgi:hypothetical protein
MQTYGEVKLADVVRSIRCQLREATWKRTDLETADAVSDPEKRQIVLNRIKPRWEWFSNQTATVDLKLQIDQSDSTSASAGFEFPLLMASTAGLNLEGGYSTKAKRNENFSFDDALVDGWKSKEDIYNLGINGEYTTGSGTFLTDSGKGVAVAVPQTNHSLKMLKGCYGTPADPMRYRLLAGDLGIGAFLERIDEARDANGFTGYGNPDAGPSFKPRKLSYTVEFVLGSNSSAGPEFKMIPIGTREFGGSFSLKSSRSDTHTATISFSPVSSFSTLIPVTPVWNVGGPKTVGRQPQGDDAPPETFIQGDSESNIPLRNQQLNDKIILERNIDALTRE